MDLDNIWKWLGFNKKYNATTCLEKYFKLENDYKVFAPEASGAKTKGSGGHNIQKYYLNVKTFKSLCLKAQTKKQMKFMNIILKWKNSFKNLYVNMIVLKNYI